MTYNEADHPRDENGKFTFKNGGNSGGKNENDKNKLVQAGDIAMKNKELKPKFVIKHAIIPKENLEKLWGKYQINDKK